jgi:hypothetical protein
MGKKNAVTVEEIATRAGVSVAHATWSLTRTLGKAVKTIAWDNAGMAVITVVMDKGKPGAPR